MVVVKRIPRFGVWLRDQVKRDDPVGDVARDMVVRCGHPYPWSVTEARRELDRHNAVGGAYEALYSAAREWRRATD